MKRFDIDNINGRSKPGFNSDQPFGLDRKGVLHLSGIRASRIRFGPANRVGSKRDATENLVYRLQELGFNGYQVALHHLEFCRSPIIRLNRLRKSR